ncbi:tRNA 2-thiouridine(34) synthase MnmA [Candidatus Parcubacteria bacterium]|nr:tRNA 2-thiouridine(34) synthase MnmA [Candidatus Parcubacteria bacterium]
MEKGKKVFVGLSGGVDSAVSAALLQKNGYDVTGVFIKIQIPGYPCPAAQDRIDAMRVAAHLKIPFFEIDLSKEYEQEVFRSSLSEFKKGRTPNPDTLCNQKIKFGVFFDFCRSKGADFVATGHYAQIKKQSSSTFLFSGLDPNKDQSYFLWMVPETVLRHTMFPIGSMQKSQVRAYAEKIGLPNFDRPDSQGLCFLGDISIEEMIKNEIPQTSGEVLSKEGKVIGLHEGAALYTMGQRHGFTLDTKMAHTTPHFIIGKNINDNTIVVSEDKFPKNAARTHVELEDINWIGPTTKEVTARYRYRQKLIPATLEGSTVTLHEPHYVPLGQSLVLYDKERCLGGGVISSAKLAL